MCERWDHFANFLADMGIKPLGLTLERKNNNGNYEKDNCHWASWEDQGSNKRNTAFVEYQGERISVPAFSRLIGVTRRKVQSCLRHRWTTEEMATGFRMDPRPGFGIAKISADQRCA